jgi:pimeloyl-ACP methyl ester carboxylesterase
MREDKEARFAPHKQRIRTAALLACLGALAHGSALADRCKANAEGRWTCSYNEVKHRFASNTGFSCTGAIKSRVVRWQVPEGTPPTGGWPVVFYYNGTVFFDSAATKPFTSTSTAFGANYSEEVLRELLDNPGGTGRKYAVFAPEAPGSIVQAWDTNAIGNYTGKDDYCFLPDLFKAVADGEYGAASQYNMQQRYAMGISSGGYNTSRMAVTFNRDSVWKALAIVSASYATCAGPLCNVPANLPTNHPPTKFYHGTADGIVPISTMRPYHERLLSQGVPTEKVEHDKGHQFTQDDLGPGGIKAWFDRF